MESREYWPATNPLRSKDSMVTNGVTMAPGHSHNPGFNGHDNDNNPG